MRLIVISGLSGSGKSVALHVLEDLGFYCVDNIPIGLLRSVVEEILLRRDNGFDSVGVGLDARTGRRTSTHPGARTRSCAATASSCEIIFLHADDKSCFRASARRAASIRFRPQDQPAGGHHPRARAARPDHRRGRSRHRHHGDDGLRAARADPRARGLREPTRSRFSSSPSAISTDCRPTQISFSTCAACRILSGSRSCAR